MTLRPKLVLPLAALVVGILGALLLLATSPETPTTRPQAAIPLVRTVLADTRDAPLRITTHGTVEPRTESDLVPEVSGRVTWVSPVLVSGGFFAMDEPLLRIDPSDYELAAERASAALARAESAAALATRERRRQEELAAREVTSAARLDDASNRARAANAALREARAALAQAERDLGRTELRAPFSGRVRDEQVDVGQFASRGTPLARVYAVDWAEVRLPIPDEELAWLDVPEQATEAGTAAPKVVLRARFAGSDREWNGRIERSEGEIDPRSRMVHVVARVEDPYARDAGAAGRTPLPVGLFVEAEIEGRTQPGVIVVPRSALRAGDRVLIVDGEERLRFRDVDVLRRGRDEVLIRDGLAHGERVCISALEAPVDGMRVRALEASAEAPAEAGVPPGKASS